MGESPGRDEISKNICTHCGVENWPSVPQIAVVQYCAGCGHELPPRAAECSCGGNCTCKPSLANKIRSAARKLGFNVGI